MSEDDPRREVERLLQLAQSIDRGPAQVALCEQAIDLADRHQEIEAGFVARRRLVQAATFSGLPDKSMVAFAWCLAHCDRDPVRFPEQRVLWQYKWVVMSLYGFWTISRDEIEAATGDIEARYRRGGLSLRPIWRIRHISARGMGDRAPAHDYLERWLAAPRDQFTDCPACEASTQVGWLVEQGRDTEALALAEPLLTGRLTCATQPQITLARVLLPLLRLGRASEAASRHVAGYRRIRREPHYYTSTLAQHLVFLALTENLGRALALFEEHVALALTDPTPYDRFHFFLAVRLLLGRLRAHDRAHVDLRLPPSFPARRDDHRYEVAALQEWFEGELGRLAARFDARNGNDHFSAAIARQAELLEHARACAI